jgi:hypothetical protein
MRLAPAGEVVLDPAQSPPEKKKSKYAIVTGALGHQLQITNKYAWLVSYYLRVHFHELCKRASEVCGEDDDLSPPNAK